jgi:hypothetical protein
VCESVGGAGGSQLLSIEQDALVHWVDAAGPPQRTAHHWLATDATFAPLETAAAEERQAASPVVAAYPDSRRDI